MPTIYVPGPTTWGINGTQLGYCEGDTRLSLSPQFDDVMTDFGGRRVPYDLEFHGCEATVSGDLIYYDEATLNNLKKWLSGSSAGSAAGSFANQTPGTLVRTEGNAFTLTIKSAYANKPAFAGMNGGFSFPFAVPVGTWDVGLGARTKRERITFRCLPVWNLNGSATLYTDLVGP